MLKAFTLYLVTHGFCNSLYWTGILLHRTWLQRLSCLWERGAVSKVKEMLSLSLHISWYDQHDLNTSSLTIKFTIYKELHSKMETVMPLSVHGHSAHTSPIKKAFV